MWIVELLPSLHFKCYRAFIFITTQLANTMTIKHFFPLILREWNTLHLIHSKIQMHSCSSRVCQGYYCLTQIAWRVKLLGGDVHKSIRNSRIHSEIAFKPPRDNSNKPKTERWPITVRSSLLVINTGAYNKTP